MTRPGQLIHSVTLQQRSLDANGDRLGATWIDDVVRDCAVTYLRGGEIVLEARLQGVTTAVITVRLADDPAVLQVGNGWRALVTDGRTGQVATYDIKAALPQASGDYVDFTAQDEGTAGGL